MRLARAGLTICCASVVLTAALVRDVAAVEDAAATPVSVKRLALVRLETAPTIDGVLDETLWEQATLVSEMHQVRPLEFAAADERTEIRVFYTRDALYVGARMYQDPARITANVQKQGADVGVDPDDWFGFDIDPWNAQRNGYFFVVNPNSVRWDGSFKNISGFDHDWSGFWEAAARLDPHGWTAEFELPFNAVSFDPDTDTWGINFERKIARTGEYIAWSSRGQQVNPSTNGVATGLDGMRQGLGLGIVPSFVARGVESDGAARNEFDPAVDIFYRITPQLTATFTANTDFSAADVDARQVNLSRFSPFFPEKRDFFLRDADIFEFGHLEDNGRPFFSRRIGLNRYGRPIDIDYGAKLSGHLGAFDLGSLYIRQGADPETGVGERDIIAARAAAHVFSESSVGVILTAGDPQSELDSTLTGADFSLRNSRLAGGRAVQLDGWYQQSNRGESADDAWGLELTTSKPVDWYGSVAYKHLGAEFNPALGFVNRAGIEDVTSEGGYRWRFGRSTYFSLIELGSRFYRADTLVDDRLGSSIADLHVSATNQWGDALSLAVYDSRERLDENFPIWREVDVPQGRYSFTEGEMKLTTNAARPLSGGLMLRAGDYYDGTHRAGELELAWSPNRHLNATLSVFEDRIRLPDGDFNVRLLSAGATIAFDAHWSWTSLAQYDNFSEVLGVNSKLHWTPRVGRNAWLVINVGRENRDQRFRTTGREITLKYTHDLRY